MKSIFRPLVTYITLFVLMFGTIGTAPAHAMDAVANNALTSPEEMLNPDGTLNLINAFHGSLDLAGWNVQMDPERGPVFSSAALAAPSQWANAQVGEKALINSSVYAIAISGTDVYVGGAFANVNNHGTILTEADRIAKWDGSNWSALGSNGAGNGSLSGDVNTIAVSGTDIYVGGAFTSISNYGTYLGAAAYIAKWDGSNWSALSTNGGGGSSISNIVNAITVSGTDIYVGGDFTNVNDNGTSLPAADYIAKWDGSNWSALGSNGAGNGSLNSGVRAIAVSGTDIYVGGTFTDVNNNGTSLPSADYVAKWDGSTWAALGSNGVGNGSLGGSVRALAVSGTDVYVGGFFTNVNNNGISLPAADYIAKWNGSNWSALGSNGAGNGSLTFYVYAIVISGTDVYVGGAFSNVNNNGTSLPTADRIAKWNGSTWSALGSNGAGDGSINNYVYAIAVSGTDMYVGGFFTDVNNNGTNLFTADYLTKWNGDAWSAVGLSDMDGSLNNTVRVITVSGTDVYVGGDFTDITQNGTVLPAADYIAKWDGSNWSALGSTNAGDGSLNGIVTAIAVSGTNVYVGGTFSYINNKGTTLLAARNIAKWDGSNWSALGSNGAGSGAINNIVRAIAIRGTDVYVGGDFSDVNNNGTSLTAADYVAKWDGGNWSALGSNGAGNGSISTPVNAIAISGTDVYVGGNFLNVNNNGTSLTAADRIAKWDGSNWSALGSNGASNGALGNAVNTIVVNGTDIYVGGNFLDVNNNGTSLPTADYIAKWDTLTGNWSALGSNGAGSGSLTNSVRAISVSGTDVYVSGDFLNVNNNGISLTAADYIAKWDGNTWSALGSNGAGNGSLSNIVSAIAVSGTDVYTGGPFVDANNNGTILLSADYFAAYGIGPMPTATPTFTATITPTITLTGTSTQTETPTSTITTTATETETSTPTFTATPTITATETSTETETATSTATSTVTETQTTTPTVTVTATESPSPTVTMTATMTETSTPTITATETPTETFTPTITASTTTTATATETTTSTITVTATQTETATPTATATATTTKTSTPTLTITATATKTATASPTGTMTATITPTITSTATLTATRTPSTFTITLKSLAAQDGWILESSETSGKGGTFGATGTTFLLGDAAADKQYRAVLSFNTASIPDNATITKVALKIKQPATGFLNGNNNPFTWGKGLKADLCKPFFGTGSILQIGDFNYNKATNCKVAVATFGNTPSAFWYSANILNTAFAKVNKTGLTQFRLRFVKDDNDDGLADSLSFYSGNAPALNRPQLVITYIVP